MSTQLKLRRGTTAQHSTFTGAEGEVTVDTTKDTLVVHDATTAGGVPLAREDLSNVPANSVKTAQIDNDAVTFAKMQNIATARLLGRASASTGDVEEISLGTNLSFSGNTLNAAGGSIATTAEAQAGTDNTKAISPLRLREGFNASGSAPVYACRAWVNFNGTGTVAIRSSGNVSSISDNGVGNYTVNFSTSMPDANYSIVTAQSASYGERNSMSVNIFSNGASEVAPSTSSARITTFTGAGQEDLKYICVSVFR